MKEKQLERYLKELDGMIEKEIERNIVKRKGNRDFTIRPSRHLASLKEERATVWLRLLTVRVSEPTHQVPAASSSPLS